MTGSPSERNQEYAASAYAWAVDRIELARRLVDAGNDVDLAPIRPAVRELCEIVKLLPTTEAACWLVRLVPTAARAGCARQRPGGARG